MRKIVLIQYLVWHFIDSPKAILKGWNNFLLFNLNYFSIPTLLRTFFSHWRKYYSPYGRTFSPTKWFESFVFNMFSRIIGAILRTVFIIIGLSLEIFIIAAGLIVFLGWLILPFSLIFGFFFGLKLIFI